MAKYEIFERKSRNATRNTDGIVRSGERFAAENLIIAAEMDF